MAKKYVFVRMPVKVYNVYKGIKLKMEADIKKVYGRKVPLTMPKVFHAVASPKYNENFIQVDMKNLINLAKLKRGGI